ncbi:hypothetical protein CJ739_4009 [Mariniflexile rhizosphaerae]|uniref:hypothetical protein n=1 Tax=unclassified Mariniflexile TaxID=2643887 RepID=UPI000CC4CA2C|nr:hypothetical protein [Mariniflexile sp. TRM1-10]AXP83067.1 hypothetical protein CJ739_4009 [Mariniflexile sp. TRM1-10]PLB19741.1 MAG: hypothetical protein TRG1_1521 [Flavobacteriaceae bacterium FS1-H7996/R]
MARYLRDLSIHIGHGQKLPDGLSEKDFNLTTHTVQDIFFYLIPTKFEFGDILKLNIDIKGNGEKPDDVKNFGGYVNYSFVDFDFHKYFRLPKAKQNDWILNVLKTVIDNIPVEVQGNKIKVLEIINHIKELKYDYSFDSKKLSKFNKSRSLKAILTIRINDNGQNASLKIVDKQGVEYYNDFLLKNVVYDFYNKLHKTKWIDNSFQVFDRNGNIFKEITIKS